MLDSSTSISVLTAIFLFVASGIFLTQTITQTMRREERLPHSFNLFMTVFMLTWSVTELLEEVLQPPFSTIWHYLHFVVMASFAVAITWRWRWTTGKVNGKQKSMEPPMQ